MRESPVGNLWELSCGRHDKNQFLCQEDSSLFPALHFFLDISLLSFMSLFSFYIF